MCSCVLICCVWLLRQRWLGWACSAYNVYAFIVNSFAWIFRVSISSNSQCCISFNFCCYLSIVASFLKLPYSLTRGIHVFTTNMVIVNCAACKSFAGNEAVLLQSVSWTVLLHLASVHNLGVVILIQRIAHRFSSSRCFLIVKLHYPNHKRLTLVPLG